MRRVVRTLSVATLAMTVACASEAVPDPDGDPAERRTAPDTPSAAAASGSEKLLVAHRGASAYAPEHTLAAYRMALEQGADYVEPDLQITRDGVLICLHDLTLERTTNVEEVFPDRYREETVDGVRRRRWYAVDFTLAEIRRLDAGSWFGEEFRGARIPTFAEAIELVRGRAGLFPETKAPEVYGSQGFDMERMVIEELRRHGLHEPELEPATPVIIQSFSPESLRRLREDLGVDLALTFLIGGADGAEWWSPEGVERARRFASGLGPHKGLVAERPEVVARAHEAGMTVIPYTFRSSDPASFETGTAEQAHFLYELGVDGLFTDNPDHFPRHASSSTDP